MEAAEVGAGGEKESGAEIRRESGGAKGEP